MQNPGGAGGGAGHSAKHTRSKKHVHGKGKHHPQHHPQHHHQQHHKQHVHTKAHHAKHPRGLAIGDWLPVCAFEALAASLRLAGAAVSDDDVLELSWLAGGGGEIAPASILEALEAAAEFGLAGIRPAGYGCVKSPYNISAFSTPILGVDVPGPHAVLAVPDGWWSWGSLWSPWTTAVSEAWAVSWS